MKNSGLDFTHGSIALKLIFFALPMAAGELFQNLYGAADSLIAGNFIGAGALASVSVCAVVAQVIIGFFTGLSLGAAVLAARFFGAGDETGVSRVLRTAFSAAVVLGTIISLFGVVFTDSVLYLISVPADIFSSARIYLRIYLSGVVFTVIYNVCSALLRSLGDSRAPFVILVGVCALNVFLDVVFVIIFRMGIAGTASATVIAQAFAAFLVIRKLREIDDTFSLNLSLLKKEAPLIRRMALIGLPAGIQSCLISFSNLFVWRYTNGFGSAVMAGFGAEHRLGRFISLPCKAFGMALTTFVSQNSGADNPGRISRGIATCTLLSVSLALTASAALYIFARPCVALFNSEAAVLDAGELILHIVVPCYFLHALYNIVLGVLRGYGDTRIPMIISLAGMVGLRQLYLAVALSLDHSVFHVAAAYPIAWGSTMLMNAIYCRYRGYALFSYGK